MEAGGLVKIIITALIGITIASYSTMSKDVTANKVKIDRVEKNFDKMGKQISEIHWYFIRSKK